jgi:MinD superfamily P-loop ATPase
MQAQVVCGWFRSYSRYEPLFHAALRPAQEHSGKLVPLVKRQARQLALDENYPLVSVDGPPGLGCPVISAASGSDVALIFTEPTFTGIIDLECALDTTAHFRAIDRVHQQSRPIPEGTARIGADCRARHIGIVGTVPFDPAVTEAMVPGEPVKAYRPDAPASRALDNIW